MLLIFYMWLITHRKVSHASSVFFQRPDLVDDDLPIFAQPNIVSIEEGFAFNKLSSIYALLVRLVSFDYRHWQRPYFAEF